MSISSSQFFMDEGHELLQQMQNKQSIHSMRNFLFASLTTTNKNLRQADLFSPGNSYACMKPKNSLEKVQETQRYFENSNCCIQSR